MDLPYSEIQRGTFLVATPDIDSGIFFHGVILVCEHGPSGSFGVVINKPLDIELPSEIINLKQMDNSNIGVRAGGPVQTNQLMLLHNSVELPQQTIEVCQGVYLGGDLQFLQEASMQAGGPSVRLCFGYAGWELGQLEREFLDGHWFLFPGDAEHVFNTPTEQLWQELLKEMGGKYATLSTIPEDLSLN